MAVLEASYLRDLLERHHGGVSAAAKAARIDRKTFHRLIHKHHILGHSVRHREGRAEAAS